jgi:TPR repeat protein
LYVAQLLVVTPLIQSLTGDPIDIMASTSTTAATIKAPSASPSLDDVSQLPPEYRFPQMTPAEASVWANNYLERSRYYRDNGITPPIGDRPPYEARLALTLWVRLAARDNNSLATADEGMRYAIGDAQSLIAWCLHQCGQHIAALAQYQRVADHPHYPDDVKGNALRCAARMILNGVGELPCDEALAFKWLERSGKMIADGYKDAGDVLLWYVHPPRLHHLRRTSSLTEQTFNHRGRDQYDPQRAISAYEMAATGGNLTSRVELVRMHAFGIGIAPDRAKALGYLGLRQPSTLPSGPLALWAAHLGYPCTHDKWLPNTIIEQQAEDKETINSDAQYTFGMAHLLGTNECKKNSDEAKTWFRLAAKNGSHHARAQLQLLDPYGCSTRTIVKEGMMTKKGGKIPTYKNRHWILDQSLLSYYKKKGDALPIRSLPLYQLRVNIASEKQCSKPFALACNHLLDSRIFFIVPSMTP